MGVPARLFIVVLTSLVALPAVAQAPPPDPPAPAEAPAARRFRLGAEIKANFRHTDDESFLDPFPFPPSFFPPGQNQIFEQTVSPGSSLEVSNVAVIGEADFTPDIAARAEIHFLDLYSRNPTSSDDLVAVREAWIRFGKKFEALEAAPGTTVYALVGRAPRFTKQRLRRLESYGLWGTAVGRFEENQVEVGGSAGKSVYWRAQVASPNPLFMRDTNALAGDNGTPQNVPGSVDPIYHSGFPIFYDAKPSDLNATGKVQVGFGLGWRRPRAPGKLSFDALAWYFHRTLADRARIRGTFYGGDILLLKGVFFPLPYEGRNKSEYGLNVEAEHRGLRAFAQYIRQDIAKLDRHGLEVELAYVFDLPGLFASGDSPVVNWIQPVVRFSQITNDFVVNPQYPAPSVGWNWKKYDFGVRLGIVRGLDLTAEYSHHDVKTEGPKLHPDELLVTVRAGF